MHMGCGQCMSGHNGGVVSARVDIRGGGQCMSGHNGGVVSA